MQSVCARAGAWLVLSQGQGWDRRGIGIAHLWFDEEGWSLKYPLAWPEPPGTLSLVVSIGNPTGTASWGAALEQGKINPQLHKPPSSPSQSPGSLSSCMEVDFHQQNIPVTFYCLIACVCYRLPSKGNAEDAAEEGKFSSEILTVPLGL